MFIAYDVIKPYSTPTGLYGVIILFGYKHLKPSASTLPECNWAIQIQSKTYLSLNCISNFLKNSVYSSLNDFFL
ncbi:hypothetical protein EZS27_009667 [termite gut metagenome]|uniref:Uncharacterized protein n=1 Tax=termite gut metagenome TaxID=433724 RepID=A0A5J4S916_9ZZZZ